MSAAAAFLDRLPAGVAAYVRRLRRPKEEWAARADLRRTVEELAFLRDAPIASGDGRHLVVYVLSENLYGAKLVMMLASSLRLRGWRVTVLAPAARGTRVTGYAHAFGLTDVVGFDRFALDAAERAQCRRDAEGLLAGDLRFQDVKDWQYQGCRIGPHILSTVSRRTLRGAPDLAAPEVRRELEDVVPKVLEGVVRAKRAVAWLRPDLGLINEANYDVNGPLVDASIDAGAPVIQMVQPWRDDALMCRRLTTTTRREHASSLSKRSLDRLAAEPWTDDDERALEAELAARYGGAWFLQARNQPATEGMERAEILALTGLPDDRPLAVVFSHVLWDANLFYGEDLFEDYGDWFVETVRAAVANPSVSWLVKLHPANVWKRAYQGVTGEYSEVVLLRDAIGELPDHVRLVAADTKISSLSLYQHADAGITVRGTPGMEMACFGKPVFTVGTGRYSGLGFTIDSATRAEYLRRLSTLQDEPPLSEERTMLAKRHALTVFDRRHWRMASFRAEFAYLPTGSHPLDHNLRAVARTIEDVRRNGDLDRWADWAACSDEVDYLHV